jgi:hypothetical protein
MSDVFPNRAVQERSDPAIGAIAISYGGGDQDINVPSRGLYISTAGNLVVLMANGDSVTLTGLLAGVVYPIAIKKITQAGSTAAGLILT